MSCNGYDPYKTANIFLLMQLKLRYNMLSNNRVPIQTMSSILFIRQLTTAHRVDRCPSSYDDCRV